MINKIDGLHLVRKDQGSLVTKQAHSLGKVLYIQRSNYYAQLQEVMLSASVRYCKQ